MAMKPRLVIGYYESRSGRSKRDRRRCGYAK